MLDKDGLVTEMTHCEKEIFEVRDEVKAALGQGIEAGVRTFLHLTVSSNYSRSTKKKEDTKNRKTVGAWRYHWASCISKLQSLLKLRPWGRVSELHRPERVKSYSFMVKLRES